MIALREDNFEHLQTEIHISSFTLWMNTKCLRIIQFETVTKIPIILGAALSSSKVLLHRGWTFINALCVQFEMAHLCLWFSYRLLPPVLGFRKRRRYKQSTPCPLLRHLTESLVCITGCKTSTQSINNQALCLQSLKHVLAKASNSSLNQLNMLI